LITDPEASKIVLTAPWPKISKFAPLYCKNRRIDGGIALVGNGANQVTPDQAYLNSVDTVQTPYSTLMYKDYGLGFPFWDETAIFAVLDPANVVNSTTCKTIPANFLLPVE
jgi:inosine-uridine nucleoside N-ribohydrolase